MAALRVFLVDDHEVVRRGVRDMLEAEDDFEVVGEAGTVDEALAPVAGDSIPTSPCSTSGSRTAVASSCAGSSARRTRISPV